MEDQGGKVLAQFSISNSGTPASAYTVGANQRALIYKVSMSNNGGSAQTAVLHIDDDGTTYNAANLYWPSISVATKTVYQETFEPGLQIDGGGSLGVDSDANTTSVFTVIGQVFDLDKE